MKVLFDRIIHIFRMEAYVSFNLSLPKMYCFLYYTTAVILFFFPHTHTSSFNSFRSHATSCTKIVRLLFQTRELELFVLTEIRVIIF